MGIFFLGGEGQIEEGVVQCRPQRTRFCFWGSYVCVNFGENRSRNAHGRIHTAVRKPVL